MNLDSSSVTLSSPSSCSLKMAAAANCFVTDPMRNLVFGVIGVLSAVFARPYPLLNRISPAPRYEHCPAEQEQALGPGGALEAAVKAREEGLVRCIGVTGHDWVEVGKAVSTGLFDTVLCWYNAAGSTRLAMCWTSCPNDYSLEPRTCCTKS